MYLIGTDSSCLIWASLLIGIAIVIGNSDGVWCFELGADREHVTGNGNPTWRATHEAAPYTAPAVVVRGSKYRLWVKGRGRGKRPIAAMVRRSTHQVLKSSVAVSDCLTVQTCLSR